MGRFFSAIRRFFSFFFQRRSEDVKQAADRQFTGNTQGIHAAYAIERDKLAQEFRDLRSAVAEVLTVVEEKKVHLEQLNKEEKEVQHRLNGAIRAAEDAQSDPASGEYVKAEAAYQRYKNRLTEIDAMQERLTAEINKLEEGMKAHMLHLTDMQQRLEALPQEEAETIAEFVTAKQIIRLNDQLSRATDSLQEGPVSTVRAQVRNLSAQARISEKLSGTDVRLQDKEYENLGATVDASDSLRAVLTARKAQRDKAAEAGTRETVSVEAERPKI